MIGETSSDSPISSWPAPPDARCAGRGIHINWLVTLYPDDRPDQRDEDDGRPSAQVERFQATAAIRDHTMAKPALLSGCRISSTGSSEMIENATA
jgi:hypothetical protein